MNKRVVAGVAALLIGGGAALAGPAAANADGSGSGGSSTDHPSGPSADEPTAAEIAAELARLNAGLSAEDMAAQDRASGMFDENLLRYGDPHTSGPPADAYDVPFGG